MKVSNRVLIKTCQKLVCGALLFTATSGGVASAQGVSEGGTSYHFTSINSFPFSGRVSLPTMVDVNGDGRKEQVYFDNNRFSLEVVNPVTGGSLPGFPINLRAQMPASSFDPQLYGPSFPSSGEAPIAFEDLDGVPGAEIVIAVRGLQRIQFSNTQAMVYGLALFVIGGQGTIQASRFDRLFEPDLQGVSIARVQGNPKILISGNPQYGSAYNSTWLGQFQIFSPNLSQRSTIDVGPNFPEGVGHRAVGDIDNDGTDEVAFAVPYGPNPGVEVRHLDSGLPVSGYPIPVITALQQTGTNFAMADINGDGFREVLVVGGILGISSEPRLHVFDRFGALLPGWPATLATSYPLPRRFLLAAGDVNADGVAEAILSVERGAWNSTIGQHSRFETYAFDRYGVPLTGWPSYRISNDGAEGIRSRFALIAPDMMGTNRAMPSLFLPTVGPSGYSSGCSVDVWSGDGNLFFSYGLPFAANNNANCNSLQMTDVLGDGDADLVLMQMHSLRVENPVIDFSFSTIATLDAPYATASSLLDWPVANADLQQTRSLPVSVPPAVPTVPVLVVTPRPTPGGGAAVGSIGRL